MKTKTNLIKTFFCWLTAIALIITANLGLINLFEGKVETFASTSTDTNITFDNANFSQSPSSKFPFAPNQYTTVDVNEKSGVVSLDDAGYSKYEKNPLSSDPYVLMLDTDGHYGNFGYVSNNTIDTETESYYMITVDVYNTTRGIAYIELLDSENNNEVVATLRCGEQINDWKTHLFFVQTDDTNADKLKLGLKVAGNGVAMFDNISVKSLTKASYEEKILDYPLNRYKLVNDLDYKVTNYDLTTTDFVAKSATGDTNTTYGLQGDAYFIQNNEKSYLNLQATNADDNYFTFEQNRIYKVSVDVKVENLSGNANLQLIQTNVEDGKDPINSEIIKITSSTSGEFKTYNFFVKTYPHKSSTYTLAFGLGSDNVEDYTSGKITIKNLRSTTIDNATFTAAATGTTAEKIELTRASDANILTNGNFHSLDISDRNEKYPAKPSDWTVALGDTETKQYHGVVNTTDTDFVALKEKLNMPTLSNCGNIDASEISNNVLLMANAASNTMSYTSAIKSVEKKTYNKFSVNIQTQNANAKVELVAKTNDSNKEFVLASAEDINTYGQWKTVNLYLYSAYNSIDVSLKVTLDTTNSGEGFLYVDNACIDATNKSTFNGVEINEYNTKADMTDLMSYTGDQVFYKSNLFTASNNTATAGIVDLNKNYNKAVMSSKDKFEELPGDNKKVVGIRLLDDGTFTYTSNIGFKLTSGEHYHFTIWVYTQNIGSNNAEADVEKLGANIKLSKFDDIFTNIISDREWTEYHFYVNPSDDVTTYLELSLGNDTVGTKGDVFFGAISFDDTMENFDDIKSEDNIKVLSTVAEDVVEDEDNKEDESNDSAAATSNWFYALPSIIFAIAIIVAIVAVMSRKIKWKKPSKKAKNEYDRNKTVSKQYYMRKATTLRESKIRDVDKQLETLMQQRLQYEDQYKADLSKLRQLKLRRGNANEISILERDMKKNQKYSASIGININRLENDRKYMLTDAYINSLMKQLAREGVKEEPSEENK